MTSIVGISPSNMIRAVVWRPMDRIRSTTKPASASTSRTLPSSEGWKLKPGSGIQDLAPRAQPRVVQPRRAVHEHEPDGGVDRLAVDVVVRLAFDVVLRRAVERDQ